MIYSYKKNCKADVLIDIVSLDVVYDKIIKISIGEYDGVNDNIHFHTENALLSGEHDTLTTLVNSYSTSHALYTRKILEDSIARPAMAEGRDIIAKYSSANLYAQKTNEEIAEIVTLTQKLTCYLFTGSLEMAKAEMETIAADLPVSGSITEAEADEFIRRIQVSINKIKGT